LDSVCKSKYGNNSKVSALGNNCECNVGYSLDSSTNECVTLDKICQNKYGSNAIAVSGNRCECKNAYTLNSTKMKCISYNEFCKNTYGNYSSVSADGNRCECLDAYTLNKVKNKCITRDEACKELYGPMSINGLSGNCECMDTYKYNGFKCVENIQEKVMQIFNNSNSSNKNVVKVGETKVKSEQSTASSESAKKTDFWGDLFMNILTWLFGKK
jgi:hypothetical protein